MASVKTCAPGCNASRLIRPFASGRGLQPLGTTRDVALLRTCCADHPEGGAPSRSYGSGLVVTGLGRHLLSVLAVLDRPVEANDHAVEHLVLDDVPRQRRVLRGSAKARRKRGLTDRVIAWRAQAGRPASACRRCLGRWSPRECRCGQGRARWAGSSRPRRLWKPRTPPDRSGLRTRPRRGVDDHVRRRHSARRALLPPPASRITLLARATQGGTIQP
jgi:hypothetical protein